MIPRTVTAADVLAAIRAIDRDGVPRGRASRGFDLLFEGKLYPPKYVVALATEAATGLFPDSETFSGGDETNGFLRALGFTVVAKSSGERTTPVAVSADPSAAVQTPRSVRVGRVFLDLGITMTEFRRTPKGPPRNREFWRLIGVQSSDRVKYRDRVVSLIRAAHDNGAEVVVLPACAIRVDHKVSLESYLPPDLPWLVAGDVRTPGEGALVARNGVVQEQFDSLRVHWLDAGPFSMMVAISSTIAQVHKRQHPPVISTSSPPVGKKPVLLLDVGHQGYSGHYYSQTLRCVARDAPHQPAVVVLSSWMYSTTRPNCSWCQPSDRVRLRRVSGADHGDILDIVDIDFR